MGFEEKYSKFKHEEDEFLPKHDEEFKRRSPLSRFIVRNFFGANVTITLVNGQTLTGEVVDGFDNVIALKQGAVITFINERFITTFI